MTLSVRLQQGAEKGHSIACGADDLRHMLERSNRVQRTLSYRGGGGVKPR